MHPDAARQTAGIGGDAAGWGPPAQQPAGGPARRPRRSAAWLALAAVIIAAAALVVAVVGLIQRPSTAAPTAASRPASTSSALADTTAADRTLCDAIAPLMAESDRQDHAFIDAGLAGSPERDTAIPKYRSQAEDWSRRIQDVLDDHAGMQPFFRRTLQRYIDDRKLLVANVRPGPATKYDDAAYNDSLVAYGGPLAICQSLGVQW